MYNIYCITIILIYIIYYKKNIKKIAKGEKMAYEEYEYSYADGIVNKSITLSIMAQRLLDDNEIKNTSKFINSLVIEALEDKEYFKKQHLRIINKQISQLDKLTGKKWTVQANEL